ncbi:MAG TPA: ParB N-terminal domain-containing protein [Anaeromyxobacter sp.]|nr:ParB N-terminal domain-containing protein [Anaeromyxobacter sp.]
MELEPRTHAPVHATGAVEFVPLSAIADDATFRLREEGDVSALAASMGRLGQLVPLELRPLPGAAGAIPRYQVVSGFRRIAALRLLRRERALARVHPAFSDEDAWGLALSQALLTEPLDRAAVEKLRERLEPSGAARVAPWAAELLDEAVVRAPVEPELRERFFDFLTTPEVSSGDAALDGEAAQEEASELAALDAGQEGAVAEEHLGPDGVETRADEDQAGVEPAVAEAEAAEDASGEEVEVTPEELATDLARRMYEVNADLAVAWEAWADIPPEGRAAIVEQARWIAELLPSMEQEPEE